MDDYSFLNNDININNNDNRLMVTKRPVELDTVDISDLLSDDNSTIYNGHNRNDGNIYDEHNGNVHNGHVSTSNTLKNLSESFIIFMIVFLIIYVPLKGETPVISTVLFKSLCLTVMYFYKLEKQ